LRLNSLSLSLSCTLFCSNSILCCCYWDRGPLFKEREREAQASLLSLSFSLCRIVLFCLRISSHFHALKHCLSFSLFPVVVGGFHISLVSTSLRLKTSHIVHLVAPQDKSKKTHLLLGRSPWLSSWDYFHSFGSFTDYWGCSCSEAQYRESPGVWVRTEENLC